MESIANMSNFLVSLQPNFLLESQSKTTTEYKNYSAKDYSNITNTFFFLFQPKPMVVKNFITVKTHWFCATSVTINRAPRQYQKGKTDICSLKPQDDFVQVFHSSSHCYITLQYSLSC